MEEKLLLRELYGQSYVTILPDGQKIPWKPLTIGDHLYYENQIESGAYPIAYIENEIFKKCVLNPVLTKQIDKLHAGIVSTVVFTILKYSTPDSLDHLEYILHIQRINANAILHDLVNHVCQAYPAYKPEELYAMDLETFMLRVATAERKLLTTGLIKAPLTFTVEDNNSKKKSKKSTTRLAPEVPATEPPTNLAHEFKKQHADSERTIITSDDTREHQVVYTGHEKTDKIVLEHQMTKDTANIYGDYIEQMRRGEKIVIKTPEERKAAALIKAKENEKIVTAAIAKKQKANAEELKSLAEARKVKRTAKRR